MYSRVRKVRLAERGGLSLCCDAMGIALGPVPLVIAAHEGVRTP
jgi:hypothetical protein